MRTATKTQMNKNKTKQNKTIKKDMGLNHLLFKQFDYFVEIGILWAVAFINQ